MTNFTGPGINEPDGSRPGPTARCGSPTSAERLDRADHHHGRVTNYTGTGIDGPAGSPPGPTARSGSPTRQQLDRADHHRRVSPTTPVRASASPRDHGRARRRALVHQHGNNSIGRITTTGVSPTTPAPGSTARQASRPGPTAPLVHELRQQLDRADHHRRGRDQLHRHRHQQPAGDHGRA